ncbi:MAG: hypothetical protein LC790_02120 [Actinobacteria bacterium]|nr:hypothetical protein [Actinomycetota bacterium]
MPKLLNRRGLVLGAIVTLVVAGSAFAFWTAGGSGTGSAGVAAGQSALSANQTTALTAMFPGDSAQIISGDFNNSNAGPVHVNTVTASIASVVKASNAVAGTCDATDFELAFATMTVNKEIPVGTGVSSWTGAAIRFNNKTVNQDACKGATVNLAYEIS